MAKEASCVVIAISAIFAVLTFLLPIFVSKDSTKQEPERVTMNGGFGMKGTLAGLLVVIVLTLLPLKNMRSPGRISESLTVVPSSAKP